MKKEIEVLAPAGSYVSFKAAIAAGADAVYLGGSSFGARAFADNFTEEQLLDAIDYAHFHGRKVFLTVNTLLKEQEIQNHLYDYLRPYYEQGLDAVIVQDMGVLEFVNLHFPGLAIHASTQMTITNTLGAKFLKSKGAERVVPARELSLPEIKDMADATGLEIECFVHGALCYCYSGQCLLSSMIGGRSGNRGQCAQPCRLPYEAMGQSGYLLSPKDICTLDLIPDMIEAGIYSFKIEGRMKKPEYVAAVTSMYRKYVDLYFLKGRNGYTVDPFDKQILMDIYNRGGFDDGYYKKHNGAEMMSTKRPNHAGVEAFQVLSQKNREVKGKALTDIHKGDILELTKEDNYTFGKDVPKGETYCIIVPKKKHCNHGDILSRTRNAYVLEQIRDSYIDQLVLEKVSGELVLTVNEPAILKLHHSNGSAVYTGAVVEEAKNQPMTVERIEKQMKKTGNTEYVWDDLKIILHGNVFIPMQQLNEIRRNGLELLRENLCESFRRESILEYIPRSVEDNSEIQKTFLTALAETKEQLEVLCRNPFINRIYVDCNICSHLLGHVASIQDSITSAIANGKEVYLAMPHIFRQEAVEKYEKYYEKFYELAVHGVLIRNYESYQFLREHDYDKVIMLDHNVYQFNHFAKQFWKKEHIDHWTAPLELNHMELQKLNLAEGEFVGYGYLPMMVSAGCVKKTLGQCNHQPQAEIIKDRFKNQYTVKNYCDFCYNIIYNSSPLVLYDLMREVKQINPKSIRLQFSMEDAAMTERMIALYHDTLACGEDFEEPNFDFTRGHFRRGIN